MKFSHFFIDRPIFATVVSIVIMLIGVFGYFALPVTQYPEIVPPTISVYTSYSGASPEVVMDTVCAPLEQEINGVENMIYMQSQCDSAGSLRISVVFETGTDPDLAQILVQNRVSKAERRLPKEVRDTGVSVRKRSPDMILSISLISPNGTRDKLYLSNYAITQIQDRLSRVYGVSEFNIFGAKEYCMRIWLDPDRLSILDLSPAEVIAALQEQNQQIAAGKLNQPPLETGGAYELIINAKGRLQTEEEFGNIIVKYTPDGKIVHLRDVATIELGANTYGNESYINGNSSVAMGAYQLPGTNAIETVKRIKAEIEEMKKSFPNDVDYVIGLDLTAFITESIHEVYETIFFAIILVVAVVMLFLQNFRAAVIPLAAIPVSLIGTFGVLFLFGFSINNLTLFGLVLAIGIVVDDAIVVVENVERNMAGGLAPREATKQAMTQVQGALIAIVLVLSCVFVPTAFIPGITGQFYKQFAITIASSTIISGIVSLTLTPALCALMLKPTDAKKSIFDKIWNFTVGWFFSLFNICFDSTAKAYGWLVKHLVRVSLLILIFYVGLLYAAKHYFEITPTGFIPKQDQGYFNVGVQLPDGASFERTEEVSKRVSEIIQNTEGVRYSVPSVGYSIASVNASNASSIFVNLEDRKERDKKGLSADKIIAEVRKKLNDNVREAICNIVTPAPVRGIGSGSDFKLQVQDRAGLGLMQIEKYTQLLAKEASKLPSVSHAFTSYRNTNPQLFIEIDRERAQKLNVPIESIFSTMQYNLGSIYVNDFNILGRVYKVVAQAQSKNRQNPEDIYKLKVPNKLGQNVPLGSLVKLRRGIGPDRTVRYNLYPSAEVQGDLAEGYSTGQAIADIEKLAAKILPQGMGIEWTDMAYQEKKTGNTSMYIFAVCVVFVFLMLSALYESWSMPLAVILVVPLVLLFAIMGIHYRGLDDNIMSQIGFVVLIGLACKNAILIVEFAKQREDKGEELVSSVSNAAKNRLRPIMMTSLAFILGVVPLAYGSGSGFELRRSLGTSVLYGMIGVTIFGCLFTPVFYYVIRRIKMIFSRSKPIAQENSSK